MTIVSKSLNLLGTQYALALISTIDHHTSYDALESVCSDRCAELCCTALSEAWR